jgi:hypothetical protein
MTHELKIAPKYFEYVKDWSKPFELRKNDRNYQPGDIVILKEFSIISGIYSGRQAIRKISYVLKNCPEYGLDKDYCIIGFAFEPIFEKLNEIDPIEAVSNTNKSSKEMLVEAGTKPIGLTREMLGIDKAVVAGRNKQRSIEDVKQYIASELEAEYQRGYLDGLQHLSHPAEKAKHNIIKCCLEDIMNTIDATPEELRKALEDL